ncbi:MAG: uracil-DNA glycosylase family protein [Aestuariivita sp.]|nr:uracil-DNA glycosylase family protein [Aestuariivita sp.]
MRPLSLIDDIQHCRICANQFAMTMTKHAPRPVVWFTKDADLLIMGQAPGMRVHLSRKPFTDPSGVRLRTWLGLRDVEFYDRRRIAIVPMAFCFPGYDQNKSDLAPPSICAKTWHPKVMSLLENVSLKIILGGYAQKWYLNSGSSVTATVANWERYAPEVFPLPHPSWRNNSWLKNNQWFEEDLLPVLRLRVREVMNKSSVRDS